MISRVAVLLLSVTASCYGGLLGAGVGEGSCPAAPFRSPLEALKWPSGCPAGAECCTEFGYCRPQAEWVAGAFRDCNGVSNGKLLGQDVIDAENAAAASGDARGIALLAVPAAAAPLAAVAPAPAVAINAAPAVAAYNYAAAPAVAAAPAAAYAAAPVAAYAAAPVAATYNNVAPAVAVQAAPAVAAYNYAAAPAAAYAAAPAAAYAAAPVAATYNNVALPAAYNGYAGNYLVNGVY